MKDNHDKASVKIDPEMTKTREESIVSKDGREWDYVVSTKKSGSEKGKEWRWVEDKGKKGKGKEGKGKVGEYVNPTSLNHRETKSLSRRATFCCEEII